MLHVISLGPSHYCEKARWALDRAGITYRETKHVIVFHMLFTRGLGADTSCPKLIMEQPSERMVLQESTDILQFAEKNISQEENRLYPSENEIRTLVQSWEVKFDKNLGPHVRRWAYCHLLFDKCSYKLLTEGTPFLERALAWFLMPVLRRMAYNYMHCNKPGAKERSLKIINDIFQEVDDSLADGRPYICGSRFTAADLTFAALAGPMINPPGYGGQRPSIDEVPKEMRETQLLLRKTPAGQHVLKLYETERYKVVT